MSQQESGTIQLSHGQAIAYKAYARTFEAGSGAILYLVASCYYPIGNYEIFFEAEYGLESFKLMEKVPGIAPQLITYYVASWTTSQPLVEPPTQVTMIDAWGKHQVKVQPWDATIAASKQA
jgi:hypothetical protein